MLLRNALISVPFGVPIKLNAKNAHWNRTDITLVFEIARTCIWRIIASILKILIRFDWSAGKPDEAFYVRESCWLWRKKYHSLSIETYKVVMWIFRFNFSKMNVYVFNQFCLAEMIFV